MDVDHAQAEKSARGDSNEVQISRLILHLSNSRNDDIDSAFGETLDILWHEGSVKRWLVLASLFTTAAAVVTTLSALRDSVAWADAFFRFESGYSTFLQAALLITALAWFGYAWQSYRHMVRARKLILKTELVDLWLRAQPADE